MSSHDTAGKKDDQLLREVKPAEFIRLMQDFRRSIGSDGRALLRELSEEWREMPITKRWLERKDGDSLLLRQQDQAKHALTSLGSQFETHSPLSHSMYGPPEAPYPPLNARERLLAILHPTVRNADGVDILMATAIRYDGLVSYLNANQWGPQKRMLTVDPVSTGASAGSGGLAADYSKTATKSNGKASKSKAIAKANVRGNRGRGQDNAQDDDDQAVLAMQTLRDDLTFAQAREIVNTLLKLFSTSKAAETDFDIARVLSLPDRRKTGSSN